MGMTRKGFTLIESVMASIVLGIVAVSMIGLYAAQKNMLQMTLHRVEAVNCARASAELLLDIESRMDLMATAPKEFNIGNHDVSTDPAICSLPDSDLKNKLKGKLYYTVKAITLPNVKASQVEITVEWEEINFNKKGKETIVFAANFI